MARIGVVVHAEDAQAKEHLTAMAERLEATEHELVTVDGDAPAALPIMSVDAVDFAKGLDLAISLGGDGTMLRTVRLLDGADVRILGVNFGDLGYLTVCEPDQLADSVARTLAGDHSLEERMLVMGELGTTKVHALNDLVVERAPGDTSIRVGVAIDGARFTSYPVDGMIVSTPTGSTAYALSARGPIVDPTHESIQLTPVSPHMLFDRTLIFGPDTVVDLTIEHHRPAVVSVDGRTMLEMEPGDTIRCSRSPNLARLVTFGARDHLAILKSKLGLTDR